MEERIGFPAKDRDGKDLVLVLILIVMEERIGSLEAMEAGTPATECLNPYCNGRKNRIRLPTS